MGGPPPVVEATLKPATVAVEAGAGASSELRVHNPGPLPVELALEIVGGAAAWAWAAPRQLALAPGAHGVVRVVFRPPRTFQVGSGPSPFQVRLVPGDDRVGVILAEGVVDVAGFTAVAARLVPPVLDGRRKAIHRLVLDNEGTAAVRVAIAVATTGGATGAEVAVDPTTVDLVPRGSQEATVAVAAQHLLFGWRPRLHRFQLSVSTAGAPGEAAAVVEGALRQVPVRALIPTMVLALLLGIAGGFSALSGGEDDGAGQGSRPGATEMAATVPPEFAVPRFAVGTRIETFVDSDRATRAFADFPARPERTLETMILYPAAGPAGGNATEAAPPATAEGPFPLIVFAHGSGGLGERYFGLLQHWAAAGYVVAAPVFPFARVPEQASPDDYPNQPGDMSVVADELLARSADPAHELAGLIDPERLGAAGHSLGGMTALGLVANTCCHDPRFDAGIVLAGREVPFPGGDFWVRISTPVLFIHGDADSSVVYPDGRAAFAQAPPPKHLLTLVGADHSEPYQGSADLPAVRVVRATTLAFFDHHLRGAAVGIDRMVAESQVEGTSRIDSEH